MKLHARHPVIRHPFARGFTLMEMLVALVAGVMLAGVVVSLSIFTSRSFFMIGNYVDLDSKSRVAVDILGQDVRDSNALLAFSTNSPQYLELSNNAASKVYYLAYYTNNGTLMLTNVNTTNSADNYVQMLLTNCDVFQFNLYSHGVNTNFQTLSNIVFYAATNGSGQLDGARCKLITLSWKCSRTLFGSKFNTESVQTAQIVLRNKTSTP